VTINQETLLVGWREVFVDVSDLNRSAVDSVGFYTSTQQGWDANKKMVLNIDQMYLTTGNKFVENGYIRFIHGDAIPKDYYRIEWDSLDPANTTLRIRTRFANNTDAFDPNAPDQPSWSNLTLDQADGGDISNPTGELYKYIQIEVYFEPSQNYDSSPELFRLHLFARNVADLSQFVYDTRTDWESGTLVNLDTATQEGSITLSRIQDLNSIFAGTSGAVVKMDDEFKDLLAIAGGLIPRSTNQALNDEPPSFGQVSGLDMGIEGSFWIADTQNDRVINVDETGNLVAGFYGSFLEEPEDTYGREERGPGSNVVESLDLDVFTEPETEETIVPRAYFDLFQSIYNPYSHKLYMLFNNNLDLDEHDQINLDKAFLSVGANRFYLHDSQIEYFGIDRTKYNLWDRYTFSSGEDSEVSPRNQFDWDSHALEITLAQSEYAAVNSYLDFLAPALFISNLYENKIVYTDTITVNFLVDNISLGGSENYQIAWELDGAQTQYSFTEQVTISSLTNGTHYLKAYLVEGNRLPLTNIEAQAEVNFIYSEDNPYTESYIAIKQPHGGQKVMSSTVGIVFEAGNFVITPNGNHVRYLLDDDVTPTAHYSDGTIVLRNLSAGEHEITLFLADSNGDEIVADYGEASITFFVHNENTAMKVFLDRGFIDGIEATDLDGTSEGFVNDYANEIVDVGNIYLSNINSPVDVQFIANETSQVNPSGEATVLVAKLRSLSSTEGLASSLPVSTVDVEPTMDEMYGSLFLDGHSVTQLTMDNDLVFSNNAAKFAKTKSQSLRFLGDFHVLTADAVRKRAIISYTDLANEKVLVAWEYLSDRFVSDARSDPAQTVTIKIYNDRVESEEVFMRRGTTVIWENYATNPIYIYSGETTSTRFNNDPDLTLYGDDFISPQIPAYQVGAEPSRYAITFDNKGDFPYFIYPNIAEDDVVGTATVQENNSTNQSDFLIVENDPTSDFFGNRVIRIDMWGNVVWSFGEGMLYNPKDIRQGANDSYFISV